MKVYGQYCSSFRPLISVLFGETAPEYEHCSVKAFGIDGVQGG